MQTYTAIIIGSGFGGMTAALKLKQLGITDFLILERRPFAGGTWCQNTYPGAAVDVPSTLYSLSTEHFPWKQKLADQSELHTYTEQVMAKHNLHAKTQLGATVVKVQWQEQDQCWQVDTEACGNFRARFLVNASGPLSHAKIPDFPGRDTFEGKSFHTNEWDHSYDLRNKSVAVIGSSRVPTWAPHCRASPICLSWRAPIQASATPRPSLSLRRKWNTPHAASSAC